MITKTLQEMDATITSIETDVEKAYYMVGDIVEDYFGKVNPEPAMLAFAYRQYSVKSIILLDIVCKLEEKVKNLDATLQKAWANRKEVV